MFAGSPIKRIGVKRMIRNCLIAAGNSGDASLVECVEAHLQNDDPVIAEAAEWALAQIECSSAEMQAA
jgi:epoxyqueuosine reductase